MQPRPVTATLCGERNNKRASWCNASGAQGVPFLATGRDGAPLPPALVQAEPVTSAVVGLEHLTPRQIEVLRLVARGMTNNEIAETLFLSRRTVHAHLRSIFHKLGVGHRSAATRYAIQHGLL
jgi:DNA-binding NarL/FixJ family response regulator